MEKKCKNCEHYQCQRKVAKFLGTTISQVVNKPSNKCGVSGRNYPSGDTYCNCFKFQTWYALQHEIDRIKDEKERKRNEQREANIRRAEEYKTRSSQFSNSSDAYLSKSSTIEHSHITPEEARAAREAYIKEQQDNVKKLKLVPIILTILNVLLLVGGIVCKVLANSVIENNQNSSSYYAKQNIDSAKTTSSLGTAMIIISVIVIVLSWAIWGYKYYKAKKLEI